MQDRGQGQAEQGIVRRDKEFGLCEAAKAERHCGSEQTVLWSHTPGSGGRGSQYPPPSPAAAGSGHRPWRSFEPRQRLVASSLIARVLAVRARLHVPRQ